VGLSVRLERSIAGGSFSAHVNRQRLDGLRQLVRHRAVSSAIIRPRTMNPLETDLAADDIDVSCDQLDRIDEIVPPDTRSASPTTCGARPGGGGFGDESRLRRERLA
jgi:hypothetical protein